MHRQSAPSCSVRGFQGQTALAALEASCAAKPRQSFQKQLERAKRKAFHYLSQNLKEDYCNCSYQASFRFYRAFKTVQGIVSWATFITVF